MTESDNSNQSAKTLAILEAAKTHFAQNGFEEAKLSDIAKNANVAVGTIYLRYQGKAELLAGVLQQVEKGFCEVIDSDKIWSTPFPERFRVNMQAIIDHATGDPHLPPLMAMAHYASQPKEPTPSALKSTIEAHLCDGIKRKELRADIDTALVAQLSHSMVEGGLLELMNNPSRSKSEIVDELVRAYSLWLV